MLEEGRLELLGLPEDAPNLREPNKPGAQN